MRHFLLFLLAFFSASPVCAGAGRDYAEGQIWSVRQPEGQSGASLKIQKIEDRPVGKIYHVSLIGLHLAGGRVTEVHHLPLSRETLDASLVGLVSSSDVFPDFREGYEEWKRAQGGVFTITVAEILVVLERNLLSQLP